MGGTTESTTAMGARVADLDAALDAAIAGDEHAFAGLVEPLRHRLWGVCLRITGRQADAEDALQDCLVAAWRGLAGFRRQSSFSTWIYRIASNAALAVVRRRREFTDEFGELPDERADFAHAFAERDRVQRALAEIPENFRVALVLREYGELSYDEIAEHQQIGVQTVKSRINRARSAVREVLESAE